ncbi:MAG: WecB/TagA/CpsF family glycosyltransferase [Bacteroidota bacterium]|jgi:N-acetylglucosaminyldiphosphoundecaprenol N-acetyl-beta-D-mannosaminyltransferase|nr:WecB/TagA/CpsF family glycosyltransferase [Bacteroidota bacterium]
MSTTPHSHRILSVRVHNAPYDLMLAAALEAAASTAPAFTTYSHFHILLDARTQPWMRDVLDHASLNVADGIAVRAVLRFRGATRLATVNATDFHHHLLDHCLRERRRVYLLGGSAAAAGRLPAILAARYPGCAVRTHDGSIRAEDSTVIDDIRVFSPDVLFLGLGSPLQFEWLARNLERAGVPLTVAAGNFLEFLAGTRPRAPRWMQASRLEWLHRLAVEPSRLWRRYLLGAPRFFYHALSDRKK